MFRRKSFALSVGAVVLAVSACGSSGGSASRATSSASASQSTSSAAASQPGTASSAAASSAPPATITMAVAPDFFYPEFYLAKDKGFLSKQNIDAKIVEFPSGVEAGQAVAAGQADITNMTYFASTLGAKGAPIRVIAANSTSDDWMAMVASASIQKPEDLYGKTVATQFGSITDYFFQNYVKAHNLDMSKIKYKNVKFAQLIPAFAQGQFDVVVTFEPNNSKAVAAKQGAHILATGGQGNIAPLIGYFVTGKNIYSNPDVATRVLKAFIETENWMRDNPDEVATFLQKKTGVADLTEVKRIMGLITYKVFLDQTSIDRLNNVVDYLVATKAIDKKVDASTFVNAEFLAKAQS